MVPKFRRVDKNQQEIVNALRAAGATVLVLSSQGQGCPDLLIGYHGVNFLTELKNSELPPSQRKLTEDETRWHAQWRGQVTVVGSAMEALRVIGAV